ncbi:MAG: peptidoglycan-binding protein [Aristaeellaceae bacterium]
MKNSKMRLKKGFGLVGALALCLLLTGCVVPPDDISTNGNYVVNNNDLPYQNIAPSTNTPVAAPTATATPTATPTRNPIVIQGTATPTVNVGSIGVGNAITAVTPQIVVGTNTATPTASTTLKNGSSGDDVRRMQQRLKELGYLTGSADGDFGDATEAAVKAFQARNGLTVDGKAGTATLNKLYSSSALKATSAPTNTPTTTLKLGDSGDAVRRMQQRLKELGYLTGSADGDFGAATEKAVRAFQARNGLTVDGKAGTTTLNKLYSSSALKPTAVPTSTPADTLKNGSSGTAVRQLQLRLKELGYFSGTADGDFGDATEAAVRAFQARNGLTVDGKAGTTTLNKLYSSTALKPTAKPTATPTAKPTATPKAESLDYYLKNGSSGTKVRTLQNRLIELGWLEGAADGKYGSATEYAVKAFQARYSSLWNDGIAGPDTLKTLYGAGAATSKTPAASLGISLEQGDETGAVKAMQKRLKELGFYKNTVDGEFGASTKAAVIAFQTANGLTANGTATTATLNKLYSADAKNADYLKDAEDAKGEEDKEEDPEDTSDITVSGYTTLKWGSTGEAVKKLQQALKNRGYYDGKIDSTYGSGVYAAVKAFQKQYNLKVDGIAGPATQMLLYGSDASSADTSTSLKKGSTGTAVRNLQYVLYELGYYDGKINGQYGDTTADAVRAFQINNEITPVDGVAGPKTLKVIYSGNALGATATTGKFDTLSRGDKGTAVVELQETLYKLGYLSAITGEFDSATEEAVKNCQRRNSLSATGKATQELQRLLYYGEPTPAW